MSRSTRNAPGELTTLAAQLERDEGDATTIVVIGPKEHKRRRGQPAIVLTPEKQKIICDVIAAGNYQKIAAQAAGISEALLLRWRQKGRAGVEPYGRSRKSDRAGGPGL